VNNFFDSYINTNFYLPKNVEKEIIEKSLNLINKIRAALRTNTQITICGDYDVDGIASSVFLQEMIEHYAKFKKREIKISIYIPSREDGYGLSIDTFNNLIKENHYVFTLDNGTHREFLNKIPDLSKDKIFIIDHHPNGDTSKYPYVLNPNKNGDLVISTSYLLDYVFQLLLQVDKEYAKTISRYEYADLVAMSLVSDMADLNNTRVRNLIEMGLKRIEQKERVVYQYLFPLKNQKVTYNNIAFDLNPRFNSIGRLSSNPVDATTILKFKDITNRAKKSYEYLNSVNDIRKEHLFEFNEKALSEINVKGNENLIFYFNKSIPIGLNGLIAQKINERYNIPTIVASESLRGEIKGSGRGFGVKFVLNTIQDNDIFNYGGHNEAIGCTIKDLEIFKKKVDFINTKKLYIQKEFKNLIIDENISLDKYISLSKEFSQITKTIPFKQKLFVSLQNVDLKIKKVFKNNFCYLEVIDKQNPEMKFLYFTKHNTSIEIVENKEPFFMPIYAEFNESKILRDFSGDLLLKKDLELIQSNNNELEEFKTLTL